MELNEQSYSAIDSVINKAIQPYSQAHSITEVTDFHLQPNQTTGELTIYNDEDRKLASVIINQWINYDGDDFYDVVERILHSELNKLNENGKFEALSVLKPYSFVLVDEDKETISDLLLVDDDTLFIDDELLKGLDQELDSFLKELLEK